MEYTEHDLRRVRELIEAYGVSPQRWPEDERRLAPLLNEPPIAQMVREETVLDELIGSAPAPAPSQQLYNAVLSMPSGQSARAAFTFGIWPFRAAWQPATLAVAALVAGIAAGQFTQVQSPVQEPAGLGLDEELVVAMGELALGSIYLDTDIEQ